jgi:hypothetical protein
MSWPSACIPRLPNWAIDVRDDARDPLRVAAYVTNVLTQLGVRCSIGGSLASSLSGEPRSTLDVDIVAALEDTHVEVLVAALKDAFYVDRDSLSRAVRSHSTTNLIHLATSVKVDLFVAGGTAIDFDLLERRVTVFVGEAPAVRVYVHTAEDVLLQKLRWFRLGGEVSDRQWRDVIGIIHVQGERLDREYLTRQAARLGVTDLLARAMPQE